MLAKNSKTGEFWALKIMKKGSSVDVGLLDIIKNEVKIMKSLKHSNIVNLIEFCDGADYQKGTGSKLKVFYLALELANGGELFWFYCSNWQIYWRSSKILFSFTLRCVWVSSWKRN